MKSIELTVQSIEYNKLPLEIPGLLTGEHITHCGYLVVMLTIGTMHIAGEDEKTTPNVSGYSLKEIDMYIENIRICGYPSWTLNSNDIAQLREADIEDCYAYIHTNNWKECGCNESEILIVTEKNIKRILDVTTGTTRAPNAAADKIQYR